MGGANTQNIIPKDNFVLRLKSLGNFVNHFRDLVRSRSNHIQPQQTNLFPFANPFSGADSDEKFFGN
jgi:hypothetical protein